MYIAVLKSHEAKPRMSVNNNDNLRVQWDLSGFYPTVFDVYECMASSDHCLGIIIIC